MKGLKYQACEEVGGIPALVGGVGKQGIQRSCGGRPAHGLVGSKAFGSHCKHPAGAGNATGGRLPTVRSNKAFVPWFS